MRHLLSILAALLLSMPLYAQQSPNINYLHFIGAPSGSCNTIMVAEDDTTGAFYDCVAGTWTAVGTSDVVDYICVGRN